MRLLSTQLVNFGSHADTTLDLTTIPSLVLTGNTGAGKSTLVEAVCYALWGEIPGGADQAVRTGATSASVTTTFRAHGQTYRVTRGRKLTGRGSSTLTLDVRDPECPAGWRNMDGANIKDTEARIIAIVGPYDLAAATWLARQGETDRFSRSTPGERRAYVGRLLGLDKYARLRDNARDMMRKDEATLEAVRPQRETLEAVAVTRPDREADAKTATAAIELARAEEREAASLVEITTGDAATLRAEHDTIRSARATYAAAAEAVRQGEIKAGARAAAVRTAETDLAALIGQSNAWTPGDDAALDASRRDETETAAQIDAVRAQGEAAAERKREAEAAVAAAEQAIRDANTAAATAWHASRATLSDRVRAAEQAEAEARAAVERAERAVDDAHRVTRDAWQQTRADAQAAAARADQDAATAAASVAETERRIQQARADARATWQTARGAAQIAVAKAEASDRAATQRFMDAGRDASLIDAVPCHAAGEFAGCKLLAGAVARRNDLAGLEAAMAEAEADLVRARAALDALDQTPPDPAADVLAPLEAALSTARDTADAAGQAQARARALLEDLTTPPTLSPDVAAPLVAAVDAARTQAGIATQRANEARRASVAIGSVPPCADPDTLEPLEVNLSRARVLFSDAVAERDRCAAVYRDKSAHLTTVRTRIRDLETRRDAGAGTAARIAEAQARLDAAQAEHAAAEADVRRLVYDRDAAAPAARFDRDLDAETRAATDRIQTATAARDAATRRVMEAEAQVRDAARALAEVEKAAADLAALDASTLETRTRLADLTTLTQVYAAVPQLIVETVIPEIEATANALLSRISSCGISVALRTQKVLKSDKDRLAETLDILVTDRVGERVYERYSGGERFEIDLALRVALTRVLSARAGLDLRTIVIDEGFGTQDAARIHAIAGVLQTIAAMFGLAIVISHVPGLADAMPHEVHVEKDARGVSTVEWISGAAARAA
jgi:DNA repair protein SbcC/Rad50